MSTGRQFYERRVERVLRYIEEHLDQPMRVEELAAVAGFSTFHFHRQFRALVGVPVARFVTLLRLRQASFQLAFADERVLDIALAAGYDSAEAFSRAFKAAQHQSPSDFRKRPDWEHWHTIFRLRIHERNTDMQASIVTIDNIHVAALEYRGTPAKLMESVQRFIAWRKLSRASPEASSRTFGVVHNDPESVAPEEFRFDICGEMTGPLEQNELGIISKTISGGRYAVARHYGTPDAIGATVMRMFREWLPSSNERVRDEPIFFHYIERTPRVAEHEQITDVYLPLL